MNAALTDLLTLLADELVVGRELLRNLDGQKRAILDWDVVALANHIEQKERWLRVLDSLEEQRLSLLAKLGWAGDTPPTFRQLVNTASVQETERDRLESLRARARETFSRLAILEKDLFAFMQNIASHIQEALATLLPAVPPVYGETGAASAQRPSAGLFQGKV